MCRFTEEVHRNCVAAKWHRWPPQHEGLRLSLTAHSVGNARLPTQEAARLRAIGAHPAAPAAPHHGRHASTHGAGAIAPGWQGWHASSAQAGPSGIASSPLAGAARGPGAAPGQRQEVACYASFQKRVATLLGTAAALNKAALRHFVSQHLPGSTACANLSPYVDPRNFVTRRGGELCNLFESRWHLATAAEISTDFHDPRSPGAPARFALDCSAALRDAPHAPGPQSARYFVSHRFHPYLPLAVTCIAGLNCMIVHHRHEG